LQQDKKLWHAGMLAKMADIAEALAITNIVHFRWINRFWHDVMSAKEFAIKLPALLAAPAGGDFYVLRPLQKFRVRRLNVFD